MEIIVYKNPVADIRLNDERLNIFPLRLEQSKHLSLLVNIILEVLANATKEGRGGGEKREGKQVIFSLMLCVYVCVCTHPHTHIIL